MKLRTIIVLGALVVGSFVGYQFVKSEYNDMFKTDLTRLNGMSQVQVQLQRTADLIPNLMNVVDRYAGHEKGTFTEVAEARSGLTALAKMNPADLANKPELQKQVVEAQAQMGQAMVKVTALSEKYPELKANTMFKDLMVEMTGSINRITDARRKVQNTIETYNLAVGQFPRKFYAGFMGFPERPFFEAQASAQNVQQYKFDSQKK
jgi:LemA protein